MSIFQGSVSLKDSGGIPTVQRDSGGKWNAENVEQLVQTIIDRGFTLSPYSVWVDKADAKRQVKPYTAKQLQAFLTEADSIDLVAARRTTKTGVVFRVPVIKFTYGTKTKPAATSSTTLL